MVTYDRQQVIGGGLGRAVLSQEGLQIQALQGERDVGSDLGGEHQLMSETLQMDTQDLGQGKEGFMSHLK